MLPLQLPLHLNGFFLQQNKSPEIILGLTGFGFIFTSCLYSACSWRKIHNPISVTISCYQVLLVTLLTGLEMQSSSFSRFRAKLRKVTLRLFETVNKEENVPEEPGLWLANNVNNIQHINNMCYSNVAITLTCSTSPHHQKPDSLCASKHFQ